MLKIKKEKVLRVKIILLLLKIMEQSKKDWKSCTNRYLITKVTHCRAIESSDYLLTETEILVSFLPHPCQCLCSLFFPFQASEARSQGTTLTATKTVSRANTHSSPHNPFWDEVWTEQQKPVTSINCCASRCRMNGLSLTKTNDSRFSFSTQIWHFWHFCTKLTSRVLKSFSKK